VYDALETEAATGWARGRFRTYIGKPKALDAYYRKLKWTAPASGRHIGVGSGRPLSVDERQAGRPCRGVQEVSQEVGAKVRDGATVSVQWFRGIWPRHAKTIDENLTTQCCWRCGKRTLQVYDGSSTMRTCGS
jgi:hypothetical protein